jgi:dipeptide transport system ATP-binding protein
MYAGQVVELQNADRIFDAPEHPYTQALLQAMPERSSGQARLHTIAGMVPGMLDRPPGCLFAPRCSRAQAQCATPAPVHSAPQLQVRCHLPGGALEEQMA